MHVFKHLSFQRSFVSINENTFYANEKYAREVDAEGNRVLRRSSSNSSTLIPGDEIASINNDLRLMRIIGWMEYKMRWVCFYMQQKNNIFVSSLFIDRLDGSIKWLDFLFFSGRNVYLLRKYSTFFPFFLFLLVQSWILSKCMWISMKCMYSPITYWIQGPVCCDS